MRDRPTLRSRFDPGHNGFDLLRLVLAALVLITHGTSIHSGEPIGWRGSTLGDAGVDGFFMVSGFLVTRSYVLSRSIGRFAWHRFLRIMPGFWACLLVVAFVVAPLAAVLRGRSPAVAFTGTPSAAGFVLDNAGLLMQQYDIAGIMTGTHRPDSFDGALWTLAFEAFCYVLIAVFGVLGVLTRRPWVVMVVTGMFAVLTVLREVGVPVVDERIQHLVFVYLIGTLAHLYAHRIPMRWELAAASVVLLAVSVLAFDDYRVLGAVPLAYVLLWLATDTRWAVMLRTDLSYGVYIYHWPIFQLLVLTGLATLPTPLFVLAGLLVTTVPAMLSWRFVERPALRHKRRTLPVIIRRRSLPTDRANAAVAR